MVDIFSTPTEVDVSQFGADNSNVQRYKQAFEYAADAEYWAKIAKGDISTIENLIQTVQQLYQEGQLQKADIDKLKQDFLTQDSRLMALLSQGQAALAQANNSIATINQKIIEVTKQLDLIKNMHVTVNQVAHNVPASGSFNNTTGEFTFNIPEGAAGASGSVSDLSTATTGTPTSADIGFFVDHTDNTVHKASMADIAAVLPAVKSIAFGTDPTKHTGDVVITKDDIGLSNVANVKAYDQTTVDDMLSGNLKAYESKADADADVANRQVGEKVVVITPHAFEYFKVTKGPLATDPHVLTPDTSRLIEKRVRTVSHIAPDDQGDVDISVHQGNPSLYIGEMLMFPYDPNNTYNQPGLLPAKGDLVDKASYMDLYDRLVAKDLPVVSETEWQAGKKTYFSWGKAADGTTDADATTCVKIRLPDWRTGEAFRSPDDATEGHGAGAYDGSFKAQIPYIVTINGKAPADDTGNVSITATELGAVSTSGGSITGSLSVTSTLTGGNVVSRGDVSFQKYASGTKQSQVNISVPADSSVVEFVKYDPTTGAAVDSSMTTIPLVGGEVYTTNRKPTLTELGAAASGVNHDITSLTGLSGAFKLPQDAVDPDDAVTLRQLNNHSGGGAANATMNGVMTNFIGAVEWFDGHEGTLPAGYILASGQVFSKSQWPDLYEAVKSGFLNVIPDDTVNHRTSDMIWGSGAFGETDPVIQARHRGKYSLIPQATQPYDTPGTPVTEDSFRVPDLNGFKAGSVGSVFLRGSNGQGNGLNGALGDILANAAPNIKGAWGGVVSPSYPTEGAIYGMHAAAPHTWTSPAGSDNYGYGFDASRSNDAYGREGAIEVRPNSATGIWIIRASGSFAAQSTNFNVIVNDTASSTAKRTGGAIISNYQVGGTTVAKADFHVAKRGTDIYPEVTIFDEAGNSTTHSLDTKPIYLTVKQAVAQGWMTLGPKFSTDMPGYVEDAAAFIIDGYKIYVTGNFTSSTTPLASNDLLYTITKLPRGFSTMKKSQSSATALIAVNNNMYVVTDRSNDGSSKVLTNGAPVGAVINDMWIMGV